MPFISLSFAVLFVAAASLYHLAPRLGSGASRAQRLLLLLAGLVFYAFAGPGLLPILLYLVIVSWAAGLVVRGRLSLALLVIALLAPLLFFKYAPRGLRGGPALPLGLSFLTFQSVGYVADVYRRKIAAERDPLMVALFVGFFPTIASGPIQRAPVLLPQLREVHRFDYGSATDGMRLFAWGMLKKLVIADRIAVYVDYVYGNIPGSHGPALLLATVLYSFQIYCDFSGYSDMAVGVARYFGFDAGRNFDHPYLAQSVGEFWRRWHISLSSWLRDYINIPLGGSRVALPRIYLNLMITFLVSGVWPGAGWTCVAWGLLHGAYQCVGRAMKPLQEKLRIPAFVRIVVTFCLVTFAWIFFRAESMGGALAVVRGIARIPQDIGAFFSLKAAFGLKTAAWALLTLKGADFGKFSELAEAISMLIVFAFVSLMTRNKPGLALIRERPIALRFALYFALTAAIVLFQSNTYSSDFIYQNF